MNFLLIGSIRGGRAKQPAYAVIAQALKQYGDVVDRVSEESLSEFGETELSAKEILEREEASLLRSDVIVAEVTTPSLGVGYLISRASALGKRIIALYCGADTLRLSGIIKGDPLVEIRTYESDADIESILADALKEKSA